MDKRNVKHPESYRNDRLKTSHIRKPSVFKIKKVLYVLVGLAGTIFIVYLISQMRIKSITIEGTDYASQVRATSENALGKQLFGSNLLLMRGGGVKSDIISLNGDQVTNVVVQKNFLKRSLKITVTDREPAAQWQTNGKLYDVDQTGKITKEVTSRSKLPLVVDETNFQVKPMTQVTTAKFLEFVNRIQSDLGPKTGLNPVKYRLRSTIKEVYVDTDKNYYILFDTDTEASSQLTAINRVLETAKAKNILPGSYIDVRIAYKAYYK